MQRARAGTSQRRSHTSAGGDGSSFGEAVQGARAALWERRDDFGALWAAYQHYGDPNDTILLRV